MNFQRIVTLILLLAHCPLSFGTEVVHYPVLPAKNDPNEKYVWAVLKLALEKSGKPYQVVGWKVPMLQGRAFQEAASIDGKIDILWSMTTNERESKLLAVKIPIDKGLLGWRIPLVRSGRSSLFNKTAKLSDLRRFTAGQGHDWPDTKILQWNKLNVVSSGDYETLFSMLQQGRFDYFPRSIMEIYNDIENHPESQIAVDQHIVIHYPTAAYFFVSPRRNQLAKDVELGLNTAISDGSFESLFQNHLGRPIKQARLASRRIIELENPLIRNTAPAISNCTLGFNSISACDKK